MSLDDQISDSDQVYSSHGVQVIVDGQTLAYLGKANIKLVEEYQEMFGDDFYLEIQNHNLPEEAGYNKVYDLAKEMRLPVIATNDVHYLEKGHHDSHDVLMCISSGKRCNRRTTNSKPRTLTRRPKCRLPVVPQALDSAPKSKTCLPSSMNSL